MDIPGRPTCIAVKLSVSLSQKKVLKESIDEKEIVNSDQKNVSVEKKVLKTNQKKKNVSVENKIVKTNQQKKKNETGIFIFFCAKHFSKLLILIHTS